MIQKVVLALCLLAVLGAATATATVNEEEVGAVSQLMEAGEVEDTTIIGDEDADEGAEEEEEEEEEKEKGEGEGEEGGEEEESKPKKKKKKADEEEDDEEDEDDKPEPPLKVPIPLAEIRDPWRLNPIHSYFKCADLLEPRLVSRCQECFKHNLPAPWEVIGFQANNKQCRVQHTIDTSLPDPPIVRFAALNLENGQIEDIEADTEDTEETDDELALEDADEEADELDEEADIEEEDSEEEEEADEGNDEMTAEEEEEEEAEEEDESDEEVGEFLELASQELKDRLHAFRTEAQKHL